MLRGDDLDPVDDARHLVAGGARELDRLGDQGLEGSAVQPQPLIGGQPVEQVVAAWPPRMSSATATACFLITSCAVSRPTPARTAAIRTLVVARKGR